MAMTSPEQLIEEFIVAWNAGKRPRVDEYLQRASADERERLAGLLNAFLDQAPTPAFSLKTFDEIKREPTVSELAALIDSKAGFWPSLLPRLRRRAKLTRDQVVEQLADRLDVTGKEAKVKLYYHQMEAGTIEPAGVSRRVLEALSRIFGVQLSEIEEAGDFTGFGPAAPAAPYLRAADAHEAANLARMERIEDASLAAPQSGADEDEVDRLFLGGR
jgi:hypothetical protein